MHHAAGKTIVALSGGVDSAVAALRLIRAGHEVEALHMTNWDDDDGYCTAAQDYQDARTICRELDIPLHRVNFIKEYRERVFADFLREYRAGRTPNPDILCNREIKFGVFLDYARRLGGVRIATGHYAQVAPGPTPKLLKGRDRAKDQSYFLHAVSGRALARSRFPLGAMTKAEVRLQANEAGLPVYAKKDSTGICFVGERPFRDFLRRFLPERPGDTETPSGEVIGEHCGLVYYTLGQRQGLGIGGRSDAGNEPWFVADKNNSRNVLIVVQGRDHPLLWSDGLFAGNVHWITGEPAELKAGQELRCTLKTRYRQADIDCVARKRAEDQIEVRFDSEQWAVTPGQYAVFYRDQECLGGGAIATALKDN